MESTGSKPEKPAPQEKDPGSYKQLVTKLFKNYRARPDQPKYSYAEQSLLGAESAKTLMAWQNDKSEEAKAKTEEAKRKFLESKEDKKHIGTIMAPMTAAKLYLESEESENIPNEKKKELVMKLESLDEDLKIAREQQNIPDELVQKVLGLMDEIETYLK